MLKGKTPSGFVFLISDSRLNNMEMLDALAALDRGDGTQLSNVLHLLLTQEQKAKLYDHVRLEDGTVPIDKITDEIKAIFEANQQAKNS